MAISDFKTLYLKQKKRLDILYLTHLQALVDKSWFEIIKYSIQTFIKCSNRFVDKKHHYNKSKIRGMKKDSLSH